MKCRVFFPWKVNNDPARCHTPKRRRGPVEGDGPRGGATECAPGPARQSAGPQRRDHLTPGRRHLAPAAGQKSWELAAAYVRLYRSLAAITGGKAQAMRDWLHSGNDALGGEPVRRILTAEGLFHVVQYLDATRGRI